MKNILIALFIFLISTMVFADDLGKSTYQTACRNCHEPKLAIAIKAPAAFDKKAWKARFKNAAIEAKKNPNQFKSAIDYLLYSVKIGKGLMHHGGLCNESEDVNKNCSDEAYIAAINYMSK